MFRLLLSFACVILINCTVAAQDDCGSAIQLMVGFPPNIEDNTGFTEDSNYGSCNPTDYESSIWFTFIAGFEIQEVIFHSTSIVDPIIIIVDDCTPGNENFYYSNCDAEGVHYSCDFEIGTQYYIMISSEMGDAGEFTIDVDGYIEPDDDCVDNGSEQELINIGSIPNNYCSDGTVWYTIEANGFNNIDVNLMDNGWTLESVEIFQVWLNGCPGTNDAVDLTNVSPSFECLNSNDVLYLEVGNDDPEFGAFGYSVSWSPGSDENDDCNDAITLADISCATSINGSALVLDCITADPEAVCNPGASGVWYSFEVADQLGFFQVTGNEFELHSGSCSSLDFIACAGESALEEVENDGSTFYILVYEGGFFSGSSINPAPINDLCINADGSLNTGSATGSTICASADHNNCGGTSSDADAQTVWYSYNVIENGTTLTIDITEGAENELDLNETSIIAFLACNGTIASEYDLTNESGFICGGSQLILECVPQGTFFIGVGTSNQGEGNFEIQVTPSVNAPENDLCSDSDDADDPTNLSNACAGSEVSFCNINTSTAHDVWYEYTLINESANLTILIQDDGSGGNPIEEASVAVFQDCNQTPIDSSDPNIGLVCNTLNDEFELTCVSGPSIFIVVSSIHGEEGDLNILIDETAGAFDYSIDDDEKEFCPGQSVTLDAGAGFDNYEWTDENNIIISSSQTIDVSIAGTYYCTVLINGCAGTDEVVVQQSNTPIVNIPNTLSVCNIITVEGPFLINLDILDSTSDSGDWTSLDLPASILDNLSNVSFLGVAPGEYRFVFTTNSAVAPCENVTDTLTVTVSSCECPDPSPFENFELCTTDSIFNLNSLISGSSEGNWSFIDGPIAALIMEDSLVTVLDLILGDYAFEFNITNSPSQDCPQADTVTLQVVEPQDVSFNTINLICNSISPLGSFMLNLNSIINQGVGEWQDPSIPGLDFSDPNNLNFIGIPAGIYNIEFISDNSGTLCNDEMFSIDILVSDCDCPILDIDPDTRLCEDESSFDLNNLIGMSAPGTWTNSPTNAQVLTITGGIVNLTNVSIGNYLFVYTLDNPIGACPSTAETEIQIIEGVQIELMDATVCNSSLSGGSTVISLFDLVEGDVGNWFEVDGNMVANPTNLDFDGFDVGDQIIYTFRTNSAIVPCLDTMAISTVTIIDCNCDDPIIMIPDAMCNNSGAELDLSDLVLSNHSGEWSLVSQPIGNSSVLNESVFNASEVLPGEYTFEFSIAPDPTAECILTWPVLLIVQNQASASVQSNVELCDTISTQLESTIQLSNVILAGTQSGEWKNEFDEIIDPNETLNFIGVDTGLYVYYYSILNIAPCQDEVDTLNINVLDCSIIIPEEPVVPTGLIIPNVFSPNNDGSNDFFMIDPFDLELNLVEIQVYDRWGNLAFEQTTSTINQNVISWDGRFNGKLVNDGVYVYKLTVIDLDGNIDYITGNITILK